MSVKSAIGIVLGGKSIYSAKQTADKDELTLQKDIDDIVNQGSISTHDAEKIFADAFNVVGDYDLIGAAGLGFLATLKIPGAKDLALVSAAVGAGFQAVATGVQKIPDLAKELDNEFPGFAESIVDYLYEPLPPPPSGTTPAPTVSENFNGEQVSLNAYYPAIAVSDLRGSGVATVTSGVTTFPSFAALSNSQGHLVDGGLSVSGDTLSFVYPSSVEGVNFASGAQNTYVLTELASSSGSLVGDITGATLTGTNIPGLDASDLSFTPDSVLLNVAGITLPYHAQGFAQISVAFAGHQTHATSLATHALT